jgi:hypothetical protein
VFHRKEKHNDENISFRDCLAEPETS